MYQWNQETVTTIQNALEKKQMVCIIFHENIGAKITEHIVTASRLVENNPNEIEVQLNGNSFIPVTERDLLLIRK